MLATRGQTLAGKRCLVSGSGNVAQYTVEKLLDLGAMPITLSDSGGFITDEAGIDRPEHAHHLGVKDLRRWRIPPYAGRIEGAAHKPIPGEGPKPVWGVPAHCGVPIAAQNAIS